MSIFHKFVEWVKPHIEDSIQDFKKTPKDVDNAIRNKILRQPQTLRDFNITTTIRQWELKDTLCDFHNNYHKDINTWIANRLISVMNMENFPININIHEQIYQDLIATEAIQDENDKKKEEEKILNQLTSQDIFSLQIYNYNSNFWNTHIKDWNDLNKLMLFKPHTPRPEKPNEVPVEPTKSDFQNEEDYTIARKAWKKEFKNREKEVREYEDRTEKTERMKAILKVGPFNRLWNWALKRVNALLERWLWAWVQHTIEFFFRPNIIEMDPDEEEAIRHILIDVKYWNKKVFIVLNHETFANIPITIVKFMKVAHELWIENVNEYFTTMIWPLLATYQTQTDLLNTLSSTLVTHPADNKIPWAKRISNHQQQNARIQLEKDLSKDNPKGQIYFCAPSGTRDIVHYGDNWVPMIFTPDESRGSNMTTTRLLKWLYSQNPKLKVYAISTNTTELKRPNPEQWVSPNNNKRNKNATVSMHLEEIDMNNFSTETLVDTLVKNITHPIPSSKDRKPSRSLIKRKLTKWKHYYDRDEHWKVEEVQCWIKIPQDIFKYVKKLTKTDEYKETGKLPSYIFNQDGNLDYDIIRSHIQEQTENTK